MPRDSVSYTMGTQIRERTPLCWANSLLFSERSSSISEMSSIRDGFCFRKVWTKIRGLLFAVLAAGILACAGAAVREDTQVSVESERIEDVLVESSGAPTKGS